MKLTVGTERRILEDKIQLNIM